jgi:hypothetical protein
MHVVHLAGVASRQPFVQEAEFRVTLHRRDAAEIEPDGGCLSLHDRGGQSHHVLSTAHD